MSFDYTRKQQNHFNIGISAYFFPARERSEHLHPGLPSTNLISMNRYCCLWRRWSWWILNRWGLLGVQWGLKAEVREISDFCEILKTCRRPGCVAGWPSFENKLLHLLFIRRCMYGARQTTCFLPLAHTYCFINHYEKSADLKATS